MTQALIQKPLTTSKLFQDARKVFIRQPLTAYDVHKHKTNYRKLRITIK